MSPPFPHASGVVGGTNAASATSLTNPFCIPAAATTTTATTVPETTPSSPMLYSTNSFGGGSATALPAGEDNSTNSLKVLEETAIDDLLSLGSGGAGGGSNGNAANHLHTNNSLTDNNTPLSPSSSTLLHSLETDDFFWRLTNPVHMELQENAKLPTFNWTVDRSGSAADPGGWQNPHFRSLFSSSSSSSNKASGVPNANTLASTIPPHDGDKATTTATASPNDDDINWGELFLESNRRTSFHAIFEHAGALQNEGGGGLMMGRSRSNNNNSRKQSVSSETKDNEFQTKGNDALAEALANVDPTPLSEIRRRVMEHQNQQRGQAPQVTATPPPNRVYPGPGHPARARPIPLPVPGESPKASSSTRVVAAAESHGSSAVASHSSLADAVAMAAVIASQQQQQPPQHDSAERNIVATGRSATIAPSSISNTPSSVSNSRKWNGTDGPSTGRSKYNAPQHATRHIAAQDASQRHAHYGFGVRHVVPAVPAPPTKQQHHQPLPPSRVTSPERPGIQHQLHQNPPAIPSSVTMPRNLSNMPRSSSPARPALSMRVGAPPPPSTAPSPTMQVVPGTVIDSNNNNNGSSAAAYERKKQRAKDARVKLNESIDRLSIAIDLAGTQSTQRAQQWQNLTDVVQHSETGAQIIKECVRTANGAKKWDRPSFVGTAATLIQQLNAQCDALMRELVELRDTSKPSGMECAATATAGTTNNENFETDVSTTNVVMPMGQAPAAILRPDSEMLSPESVVFSTANGNKRTGTPLDDDANHKRPRVEANDGARLHNGPPTPLSKVGPALGHAKILRCIASFLDPQSLVRCHGSSKVWQSLGAFADEGVWETFVLRRFGFYNVRQWRGRLDDDDAGIATSSMVLYKNMDAANVMPHFSTDGMLLLGEARLPGKVSAWTFMVERSNGETLRSVTREKSMQGNGVFVSLPVVELRTVVQNTGVTCQPLILRRQVQTVDASTRRRGDEMVEIGWDERFKKRMLNLDGSDRPALNVSGLRGRDSLCHLELFDVVVIVTYIYAKGCSTTSKFIQRSNFTKILVQVNNGMTVPLVIPFPRDAVSLHH